MTSVQTTLSSTHPEVPQFAELYSQYYPAVYQYLRCRGLDVEPANDLTSAIFERALTRLHTYDPQRGAFSTWIFTLARNLLNNYWRGQAVRRELPIDAAEEHPSSDSPPEFLTIQDETQRELLQAFTLLESRERDILSLKFAGRFNNRQIAGMTGLSESNIGVILYRSLQKLRKNLNQDRV